MDRYRNKPVLEEIQTVTIIFMLPLMLNSVPTRIKVKKNFWQIGKDLQIFPNHELRPSPSSNFTLDAGAPTSNLEATRDTSYFHKCK